MMRGGRLVLGVFALGLGPGCGAIPVAPFAAAPTPTPVSTAAPSLGAFLEGPGGQGLTDADREAAATAQVDAVTNGARTTWRGARGAFGYVEPSAVSGACRDFTHTIYVAGKPRTGKGSACRQGGEAAPWTVTG